MFDIDGVVADVRHRLPLVEKRPKDWTGFFAAAANDPALAAGVQRVLTAVEEHEIVWLTGRPSSLRTVTRRWLADHDLPVVELLMRGHRDFRPAPVVKLAELQRLRAREIALFVDDDPNVIAAARTAGFPATLADWMAPSTALIEAQDRAGRT